MAPRSGKEGRFAQYESLKLVVPEAGPSAPAEVRPEETEPPSAPAAAPEAPASQQKIQTEPDTPDASQEKATVKRASLDRPTRQSPTLRKATPAADPSSEEVIKTTLYLNESAYVQLKYLAVDRRMNVHALVIEAINKLFKEHGLQRLAVSRRRR